MTDATFIAVNVGNTRTQLGRFDSGKLVHEERLLNVDTAGIVHRTIELYRAGSGAAGGAPIVLASVNAPIASRIASGLRDQLHTDVYRIGEDLAIPIGTQLDPETLTGVDRLLNAAGAFATLEQACVVVDAGTAVTVDFVDGQGTFHGGGIAPGARLQLKVLHDATAALPEIEFRPPDEEAFGRSTAQAMLQGVYHGIRGMVWKLTERFADAYGAYPQVVATGGDAEALFSNDELIDNVVPNLTLLGMAAAVRAALNAGDENGLSPGSRRQS